ncbi:Asp-tRNA(Asn)/Glu-tRNA(Gln) amidotransferase GatCAB subunit C [Aliifodinibius salipaludis]|uniref:Aspartyl/glutamyl-tRNA(Asn/Gln) amidotransferase subunit C n=1 Tax=Fodinibius salipaludis TaxID=2032627 RepID=A0A2A2G875_9BACT|nr:Asp-tRNA(Asn)/Glu-tRNA(Gln) amidotransferase subunit GatC [Aliifodinibius salipaludis]PAU93045.1 Asp-tRNA(Asn)/Glu-tRNA(Gln) amidotransferase GatCAB subunit C [Aliifodinibius salipaludis]
MSVTKKDVNYVADLARLKLSEEETESLANDMNQILDYMTTLEELDTSDVEPLEHVIDLEYRLRDDKAKEPLSHEDALKNAPDADTDYFRVPRVIE